jgi:hypothetical protein
MADDSNKE